MSQALHTRQPEYWSFSFNISPSNEHPGLISFRMDWLALLAVQGTFQSLLQHHSSKASILQCSAFFTVQLSHPYMTTGKTIALEFFEFEFGCLFPFSGLGNFQPNFLKIISLPLFLSLLCDSHNMYYRVVICNIMFSLLMSLKYCNRWQCRFSNVATSL